MRKTRQRRRRGRRTRKGGVNINNTVANVTAKLQEARDTANAKRRTAQIKSLREEYYKMQAPLAQAKRYPLSQSEMNELNRQPRGRSGAF
jgi:hypothetical protein